MPTIKLYEKNFDMGIEYVLKMIRKELATVIVDIESCQDKSSDNKTELMAMVDNELIKGENPQELYEKIKARILS